MNISMRRQIQTTMANDSTSPRMSSDSFLNCLKSRRTRRILRTRTTRTISTSLEVWTVVHISLMTTPTPPMHTTSKSKKFQNWSSLVKNDHPYVISRKTSSTMKKRRMTVFTKNHRSVQPLSSANWSMAMVTEKVFSMTSVSFSPRSGGEAGAPSAAASSDRTSAAIGAFDFRASTWTAPSPAVWDHAERLGALGDPGRPSRRPVEEESCSCLRLTARTYLMTSARLAWVSPEQLSGK
mmetsp:Transcript_109676/g.341829  ORF Transcript_109676/g.341829 Transcript_109676/m.341829 type:complete len:238 (+) Transcript_109676:891-1604(+)